MDAARLAAVVHEHVVAIHNVETDGEAPFLVMQFVAGESLQQRIDREGPLDVCEILRIAMQTASGLAAAHAQGLVHRDVKPSNILLEKGIERTLLTDFGLARAADDASLTHTGYHPGTPQYMSPEQARGDAVDARSDLFSLGSVVYAMCTGRPPFRADTSYGILRRITDTDARPVREINPDIPEWLERIVSRLLAKSLDARFQSADDVTELLQRCLAHVQQPTTVELPPECQPIATRKRLLSFRSRVVAGIGVVALLSVIAVPLIREWMGAMKRPNHSNFAPASGNITGSSHNAEADPAWNVTADSLQLLDREFAEFEEKSKRVWEKLPGDQPP